MDIKLAGKKMKIGIWGYGKVGKSAVEYFHAQEAKLEVLDQRELSEQEKNYLNQKKVPCFKNSDLEDFLERNDFIFPSPGIDLRNYSTYKKKWITELTVIGQRLAKPVIAITGTVGKTTVTHMLSHILRSSGLKVWTGGNIGTPMLHLLQEKNIDVAVLEVSSFQLEHTKNFAPDLAIWSNFYPNHLDRHGDQEEYFNAKKNILKYQNKDQFALLYRDIFDTSGIKSKIHFFPDEKTKKKYKNLLEKFAHITFKENLFIIFSALDIFHRRLGLSDIGLHIEKALKNLSLMEHRLEKVTTIRGIDFYNDSKSTTAASTLAAVKKLSAKPIILLLGGLSKGVDRSDLIKKIKPHVKMVCAFGKEAEIIKQICDTQKVICYSSTTLDQAVTISLKFAQPADQVLLSPAGASFDLFDNYEHRGNYFKKLIKSGKIYEHP